MQTAMADLEILSPVGQTILQWNKACSDESVDNFELAMGMNGNGQENGDGYMSVDHTFHTPSFGDEEFDIPPINLPPTTPSSDTNSSDVYGSTHVRFLFQPLSHQEQQPTQPQQTQQQQQQPPPNSSNQQQQQQHHIMSPPPQMSPSPCSQQQQSGMERLGPVMTAVSTSTTMMTSFSNSPHHHHQPHHQQQMQQQQLQHVPPMQQQQQHHHQQQQQQQQQHQYGNQHTSDMYMLQIAPGNMMPPQSVQFVQQYAIPNYNGSMQQHMHMQDHLHHHQVPQQHHAMGGMHHHGGPMVHHHEQQLLPPSPMMGPPRHKGPGSVGSSPPGSNHTSPGLETSEDSDDSGHLTQLMCGMKRPSPEPVERPPSGGKTVKKPKVQKKKKKRDPNEPQKPVSAYALFFRDTQAAIKGQNPNASFGEVSKIVASMWDGLDIDHKNVYKKKTEAAKKEYLKALAAYRASLVSKAANEQSDNIYGSGANGGNTPTSISSPMTTMPGQALSPLQKKSPLLTSLMEGTPVSTLQTMNNQSLIMGQSPMGHHSHMHLPPHSSAPPSHQILHQMLSPGAQQQQQQQQQQQMMHMGSPPPPHLMQQQQQHHNMQMANNNTIAYTPNISQQLTHPGPPQQGMMSPMQNNCQPRSDNPQEWDRDYCNNDCVVSHCRDVFSTWVASRPQQNSYASVK